MIESSSPPDPTPPLLVETRAELERLAEAVRQASRIALDVEANSLFAYRERVCVVQVTVGTRNFIVDPLAVEDLSPLARAIDREDVEVLFHGGDYDIALLSREHAFRFHRVFDTMIAATILGEEKVGLADLVREATGVELDKKFQKADWGKRPLTAEQLDYLHRDTAYLPLLRDRLGARLAEEDLVEEGDIEFRRLAGRQGMEPVFDPEGWRGLKGANRLDAAGRAILRRLWVWRDAEAARLDRPPFKVLPPRMMVDLALRPPRDPRRPEDLRVVPAGIRRRFGSPILGAVRDGLADADGGREPPKGERVRVDAAEAARRKVVRAREDALRAWRRKEARARGVPNLVVLPNRALGRIAHEIPGGTEQLAADPDVGPKRAERYGEAILEVARRAQDAKRRSREPAAGKSEDPG